MVPEEDPQTEAVVGKDRGMRCGVIGRTRSFRSKCSDRNAMHGLSTLMKAKPGQRMPSTIRSASSCGRPEKPRAINVAPAAMATASGSSGRSPSPPGAISLSQSPRWSAKAGPWSLALLAFAVIVWMTEALDYAVSACIIAALMALMPGLSPNMP